MVSTAHLPRNIIRRGAKYVLRKTGLLPVARSVLGKPPAKVAPQPKKRVSKQQPTDNLTIKNVLLYMNAMIVRNPSTHAPVVVYFEGNMTHWYQLEMWLSILNQLNKVVPVSLVIRNQAVFRKLVNLTDFQVFFCITIDDVMQIYDTSEIKCILYVNHAAKNFQSLINRNALHIHINHGESDKLSTITNQATAYDYVYVVGDAAWKRYEANLLRKDMSRFIKVGRPQLEHITPIDPDKITFVTKKMDPDTIIYTNIENDAPKKIVLYAPTWEGTHQSMNYSSITSIGVNLVKTLLADPDYRVIYKAHPSTGSRDGATRIAHQDIINLLNDHEDGLYVADGDINAIYPTIDIPIFDNSTVMIDYLAQDRPFLMTDLFHRAVGLTELPQIVSAGRIIKLDDIKSISDIIQYELSLDLFSKVRNEVKSYYLGDFKYTEKESTQAFIDHIQIAILERDTLIAKRNKIIVHTM